MTRSEVVQLCTREYYLLNLVGSLVVLNLVPGYERLSTGLTKFSIRVVSRVELLRAAGTNIRILNLVTPK